ncbi:MAG: GNAT family N-acetyltransferase [Pseudonocardia sp.]|nr:GNAT family N-acetyltransferase [Pseudonocardia sp.]
MIALGRLIPGDAPSIAVACSDPDTQRWLPLPTPYTIEDAVAFIRRQDETWATDTEWIFAARRADRGVLVGTVGVHPQGSDVVSLGYWTAPGHRCLGYASRAVRLATLFAFDHLHASRVEIIVDERNVASCATARRAGAREIGTRLTPADGGRHVPAVVHVLIRAESE